ncbi:recombinase family protein [Candidatus Odyssella acanthamoebae]|uniref:Resolvase n=1 Tax=Candidatus Odyssella acanthamoebae TaxID=91604 RepID=A0A077B012_9PROT|nr:recombinase family protein [Candidatus Paracaedibacter acanthamoebae]AIK96290.1 resolvase [Candidatus Paracaedibacter acanthamoebae]
MANFAYLRVSTDSQDNQNQKLSVLEYCNANQLGLLHLIEDTVSSKVPWKERKIGEILHKANKGDVIVVSEVSRLGRSALQVLEILEFAANHEISVHLAKNRFIMDGSMQATITATILGLAAQIEREFISLRTKEALAKCKQDGKNLGRPKGPAQALKLDQHYDEIVSYLRKGISKRSIAKLIECSPTSLYNWLKRRKIKD